LNISTEYPSPTTSTSTSTSSKNINTKTELIEEIKNKNNIEKLFKNYFFLLNKYFLLHIYYNSFFQLGLFLPKQIFKPQFYTIKHKKLYSLINTNPALKQI